VSLFLAYFWRPGQQNRSLPPRVFLGEFFQSLLRAAISVSTMSTVRFAVLGEVAGYNELMRESARLRNLFLPNSEIGLSPLVFSSCRNTSPGFGSTQRHAINGK